MRIAAGFLIVCMFGNTLLAQPNLALGVRQLFFMALNATASTDLVMPPIIAELWYLFPEDTKVQQYEKERASKLFLKKFGKPIKEVVLPLSIQEASDARAQELKRQRDSAQAELMKVVHEGITLDVKLNDQRGHIAQLKKDTAGLQAQIDAVAAEQADLENLYEETRAIEYSKATASKKADDEIALYQKEEAALKKRLERKVAATEKAAAESAGKVRDAYAAALTELNSLYGENDRLMGSDDVAAYEKNMAALKKAIAHCETTAVAFGISQQDIDQLTHYITVE